MTILWPSWRSCIHLKVGCIQHETFRFSSKFFPLIQMLRSFVYFPHASLSVVSCSILLDLFQLCVNSDLRCLSSLSFCSQVVTVVQVSNRKRQFWLVGYLVGAGRGQWVSGFVFSFYVMLSIPMVLRMFCMLYMFRFILIRRSGFFAHYKLPGFVNSWLHFLQFYLSAGSGVCIEKDVRFYASL